MSFSYEKTHETRTRLSKLADNLANGFGETEGDAVPEVGLGQLYSMEDRITNQVDEFRRIDQILTKLEQVIC